MCIIPGLKPSFILKYMYYFFSLSDDIEEQVCPVLLQLTAGESNDDNRSEAVAVSFDEF